MLNAVLVSSSISSMSHPLRSLFLDMDSYFASVEQHFAPELRGLPVAVAPMLVESTSCIAASYEAKAFGVKTGTRVSDARVKCPGIRILHARPPLYVEVHHKIVEIVESCIHVDHVLSIDEMVCWLPTNLRTQEAVEALSAGIKGKLATELSPAVKCSIGIAPNGWLAKTASKMKKPDGFMVIRSEDLPEVLHELSLGDLHGIGSNMELRLHSHGIHTVEQLCAAPKELLKGIWGGVEGKRLWHRLRGEVTEDYDSDPTKKSIGHGHVLPPEFRAPARALPVIHRLVQKAALRMRTSGLLAEALELSLSFTNHERWSGGVVFAGTADSLFLTQMIKALWKERPHQREGVAKANIVLGRLVEEKQYTPSLFDREACGRIAQLNKTMDGITGKFGKQALYLGGAHGALDTAQPKIAFGHIPDVKVEG